MLLDVYVDIKYFAILLGTPTRITRSICRGYFSYKLLVKQNKQYTSFVCTKDNQTSNSSEKFANFVPLGLIFILRLLQKENFIG